MPAGRMGPGPAPGIGWGLPTRPSVLALIKKSGKVRAALPEGLSRRCHVATLKVLKVSLATTGAVPKSTRHDTPVPASTRPTHAKIG